MHPEIEQHEPGTCPLCHMKLVTKGSTAHASVHMEDDRGLGKITWKSYLPLVVIIGLILITTVAITFTDIRSGVYAFERSLSYFMIGFFLVFSGFKLIDLRGFAEGYATYDLLAQRWYGYGYIYPFIELFFALSMIVNWQPRAVLWAEIIVMGFSGLGVALKIAKREKFRCACLGTALKVPLTYVTLIEDFGMVLLAIIMLTLL